jgi:hypothetical protein
MQKERKLETWMKKCTKYLVTKACALAVQERRLID